MSLGSVYSRAAHTMLLNPRQSGLPSSLLPLLREESLTSADEVTLSFALRL